MLNRSGGASQLKYSILLPTHNRADVLPYAIRSVLRQTVEDFELLVVGDGCTDETARVVSSFHDERIRWFDLPKAPHFGYANRNVALREARGEFIAFMPHDDLWLPDHLELLAARLEQSGAELAYSRPLWVIPRGLIAPLTFNLHHPETLKRFIERERNSIPAACVVHRRECFAKYGYWNAELPACGDLEMWSRIIEGGGRKNFAYLPETTCLHFRANWRTEAQVWQPQLHVWKRLHAVENFMPAALKLEAPPEMCEQEACWLAMEANPQKWPQDLRAAVQCVLDRRIALGDKLILDLLKAEEARAPGANGRLETYAQLEKLEGLAAEFEIFQDSTSWKLIQRARRAMETIAPHGTRRERLWLRLKDKFRRAL